MTDAPGSPGPPGVMDPNASLAEFFGAIDIYLFDQLLRGRIAPGMDVLDAGCGRGRNLAYLLRSGYRVWGVDSDPEAIAGVHALAQRLAPGTPVDRFRVEGLEALSFGDAAFDVVISNAVLHFARDERVFRAILDQLWRVLRPGGMLFTRLASSIGIEDRVQEIDGRWSRLPDGSERFVVDEAFLLDATASLGGTLVDPIKTTNVQGQRCMTTWVVAKP